MEFNSLKEQRQARDAAEARAAAAAASVEAGDASSQSRPSTSKPSSRTNTSRSSQATSTTDAPASDAAFKDAMANPESIDNDPHGQPIADGSLPASAPSHDPSPSEPATQPELEPMRPHNLLQATELLQSGGSSSSFAPAPILRLNAIRISGAGKALRPSYLASLCRPYMDPLLSTQNANSSYLSALYYGARTSHVLPGQPTTLPSILALTSSLASDLDKLDVFRGIEASLAPSVFPGATEEDVDVILACGKPKGRVFLKSSTDVANGEGSASVQGRIRNVFGGAENLQGSATFGTRTKQAFNVEFGGPMPGNVDMEYKLAAFSHDRDHSAFASVSESVKGVRASLNSSFADTPKGVLNPDDVDYDEKPNNSQHELAYEASLRQLGRLMGDASVAVRKMASTPSIKSALSWTWISDSRDSPVLPSGGTKLRTMLEYAGLGGDANHVKAEVEASTGRHFLPLNRLFPSISAPGQTSPFAEEANKVDAAYSSADLAAAAQTLLPLFTTATFRCGFLQALSPTVTHFSDRFQLGGPTSLRMFRHSTLGPKADADSLGGDAFWSLGLSCLSPIPRKPHWPLMLHSFFNAGQLCQLPPHGKPWQRLQELVEPSTSVGVGLVYMQGQLRVELNAGVPLTARKGDATRKGLQLGIGIDFL